MAETDKSRVAEEASGPIREPGFYWVRDNATGSYCVCEWQGERSGWLFPGSDSFWDEEEFTVLSARLEPPK